MKKFLMVLVLAAAVMTVAGCGSHVRVTADTTSLINPESPEHTFMIEPKELIDGFTPSIFVKAVEVDTYPVLANALRSEFGGNIAVYPLDSNLSEKRTSKTVYIYPVDFNMYAKLMRTNTFYDFTARVVYNNKDEVIIGQFIQEQGLFPKDQSVEEANGYTLKSVAAFAKKLKEFLFKSNN